MQGEIRSVLVAIQTTFNLAYSIEIKSFTEAGVYCIKGERGHNECDKKSQARQWILQALISVEQLC